MCSRRGFVAVVGECSQLALAAQPVGGGLLHPAGKCLLAGKGVQHRALDGFAQQRLVSVLAVDVDQQFAELGAVLQGGSTAIDIGSRAPFGGDYAAQQAFVIVREVAGLQPRGGWRVAGDVEGRSHFRSFAAGTHGLGVGPVAQAQAQSI